MRLIIFVLLFVLLSVKGEAEEEDIKLIVNGTCHYSRTFQKEGPKNLKMMTLFKGPSDEFLVGNIVFDNEKQVKYYLQLDSVECSMNRFTRIAQIIDIYSESYLYYIFVHLLSIINYVVNAIFTALFIILVYFGCGKRQKVKVSPIVPKKEKEEEDLQITNKPMNGESSGWQDMLKEKFDKGE